LEKLSEVGAEPDVQGQWLGWQRGSGYIGAAVAIEIRRGDIRGNNGGGGRQDDGAAERPVAIVRPDLDGAARGRAHSGEGDCGLDQVEPARFQNAGQRGVGDVVGLGRVETDREIAFAVAKKHRHAGVVHAGAGAHQVEVETGAGNYEVELAVAVDIGGQQDSPRGRRQLGEHRSLECSIAVA